METQNKQIIEADVRVPISSDFTWVVSSRGKDARIQKGSGLTLSWVLEVPLLRWGCHFILRKDRRAS